MTGKKKTLHRQISTKIGKGSFVVSRAFLEARCHGHFSDYTGTFALIVTESCSGFYMLLFLTVLGWDFEY